MKKNYNVIFVRYFAVLCALLTSQSNAQTPIISPSDTAIMLNVPACGNTASDTFYLNNPGNDTLFFQLSGNPYWGTCSTSGDTILAGDTLMVIYTVSSDTLPGGTYYDTLHFLSNDLITPDLLFSLQMTVGNNPCARFSVIADTCSGEVVFTSHTINTPLSYAWNFGDGGNSNLANPIHFYDSSYVFTVSLTVTDGVTSDTSTQSFNIYRNSPLKPAVCHPLTDSFCCGIGITQVTVFPNSNPNSGIHHQLPISGNNFKYFDLTCTDSIRMIFGQTASILVSTDTTLPASVSAWLDFNNDGNFDSTEMVLSDPNNFVSHFSAIYLYDSLYMLNKSDWFLHSYGLGNMVCLPVRMRIISDSINANIFGSCHDPVHGFVVDVRTNLCKITDGIESFEPEYIFSIAPNPFTSGTNISYDPGAHSIISIEVYNLLGERIKTLLDNETQESGLYTINFEPESKGLYLVKLTMNGRSYYKKIIKY